METIEKHNLGSESSDTDSKNVDVKQMEVALSPEAAPFDAARTKKLIRRLDWHIVPFLSLLYLFVSPLFLFGLS